MVLANNAGEADSSAGLKLIKPITFVRPLEDVTVPKGHRAVLNAETDRAPQIVKWFKNGEEIQPRGAKAQPKFVSDTKFRLEIPDTDEDDTADYKVHSAGKHTLVLNYFCPIADQSLRSGRRTGRGVCLCPDRPVACRKAR